MAGVGRALAVVALAETSGRGYVLNRPGTMGAPPNRRSYG